MIHTTVRIRYGSLVQSLTLCAFLAFIFSCSGGGGGSDGKSSSGSGSISFGLAVQEDSNAQVGSMALAQATSPVDCVDDDIQWILAEVYDKNGILVAEVAGDEKWSCDSGTGTIKDVPAGDNLTLVVRTIGFFSEDYNHRGEIKGITVLPGQNKDEGTVRLWPLKPPPAVTTLTASEGTEEDMIVLEWEDVRSQPGYCSEDGYYIYRQPDEYIGQTKADITSFTDRQLCESDEICYRVVAFNRINEDEIQESEDSNEACGYTADCPVYPPDAPFGLSASEGDSPTSIRLQWQWEVKGSLIGFKIYRSDTGEGGPYNDFEPPVEVRHDIRSYDDDNLACGGDPHYYYKVTAYNSTGESEDSNVDSGYTDICPKYPPDPPTGLRASDGTYGDRIRLTWNDVDNEMGYNIYRSTSEYGTYSLLRQIGANRESYDDEFQCRDESVTYWYIVRAYIGDLESGDSNIDSGYTAIVTIPGRVATFKASPQYPGSIKLDWSDVDNEEGYRIFRTDADNPAPDYQWPHVATLPADTTSWVDDDDTLTQDCPEWRYSIYPYNCAGYADYSPWVDIYAEGCGP